MREAKIVCKSSIDEFNSLDELVESNDFIGVTAEGDRYFISKDALSDTDKTLAASVWGYIDLKEYEQYELSENFQFFIFDSANELYRWMIEGE